MSIGGNLNFIYFLQRRTINTNFRLVINKATITSFEKKKKNRKS